MNRYIGAQQQTAFASHTGSAKKTAVCFCQGHVRVKTRIDFGEPVKAFLQIETRLCQGSLMLQIKRIDLLKSHHRFRIPAGSGIEKFFN
jgi:hypothetical protein